jgi:chromosome segregation protein
VFLKSLTLRGFKSFADSTTLEFQPGVTVIVGPNGSGKSNVVDAVAWVLGAQGPSVVRSSRMDDVIFAGTAKRPALGRAEVTLTIDNSTRRLPIDLAEVTITRTLFRTGESEYSMNGASCRLLDIQELLSDAGVGRQQHVIMGQGQLDSVLSSRPEDRRAIIEEAAGVLKFRRRRERAERRLESTEANLLRLQDLQREVRRQVRPLERQAEAARRHDSLAAELRALRLYVAGRELESLQRRLAEAAEAHERFGGEEARLKAELSRLDELVEASEGALGAEQANDVTTPLGMAERLAERASGIANVIAERRRAVASALAASTEADVISALEAEAARIETELAAAVSAVRLLAPEWEAIDAVGAELARDEAAHVGLRSAGGTAGDVGAGAGAGGGAGAADASSRSGSEPAALAPGDALGIRRRRDEVRDEFGHGREQLARYAERQIALMAQRAELEQAIADGESASVRLDGEVAGFRAELGAAEEAERVAALGVTDAEAASRDAVDRAHSLGARAHALQVALDEAHARAGVERLAGRPGVLGTLMDVVEVDEGCERAFEAAVEEALGAVVVDGGGSARAAVEHLHASGLDGAVLAVGSGPSADPLSARTVPHGEELLRGKVRATRPGVEALLDHLLAGVILCRGQLVEALDLAERTVSSGAVVVTIAGDRFSAKGWRLGAGRAGATRAALDSVADEAARADAAAAEARQAAAAARARHAAARSATKEVSRSYEAAAAEARQGSQRQADARHRLQLVSEQQQAAEGPHEEIALRVAALGAVLEEHEAALGEAERAEADLRAVAAEAAEARRRLDERARALASLRADLEVKAAGLDERRTLLSARRDEIEGRLAGYEAARTGAAERRRGHESASRALERLAASVQERLGELSAILEQLGAARRRHEAIIGEISTRLANARSARSAAERGLTVTRESLQRVELDRAELRVRLEAATDAVRNDLDCEPADAVAAPCPELPPGTPPPARLRELDRELRLLGPVNPLALEELGALQERDQFLNGQLEDVRSTRRELGRVIKAVDDEIVSVFTEAFADVARHFEALFETLFPGGTGRLSLVDPSELLQTGIEIEARPAGRNVRRLSLLSGGERSLTALAFLFAVFRSRPSPFYLMDEVEAALDDVNLHRFLGLLEEFRGEAQLLVVSHQKRTMESADVIYGVSMQPGGASKVVSERLGGHRRPDDTAEESPDLRSPAGAEAARLT